MRKRAPALFLALTLLLLCGCGKEPDPESTPVETGYTATGWSNPDVPKNEFTQEAFVSVGGFTIYTASGAASHIGIDVSTFQGEIDWAQVKAAGVEFAMLRAGGRGYGEHGTIYEDSSFIQNIQGALGAGVEVGVVWQDGRPFHGPCHIRMNLALPRSRVEEAFDRLNRYVFHTNK